MISSSILDLLLNKYVLGSIAGFIALIVAYFKGSASAKQAAEDERIRAEHAQSVKLRAAEAKNTFLEKKGETANENINSTSNIDQLIGMFNEIQSSIGSSPDTDKKP